MLHVSACSAGRGCVGHAVRNSAKEGRAKGGEGVGEGKRREGEENGRTGQRKGEKRKGKRTDENRSRREEKTHR